MTWAFAMCAVQLKWNRTQPREEGESEEHKLGCDRRGMDVWRTKIDKRKRLGTQETTLKLKSEVDIHELLTCRNQQSVDGVVHLQCLLWLRLMMTASPTWRNSSDNVNLMGLCIIIRCMTKRLFGGRKINGYVGCKSFEKVSRYEF